MMMYDVISHKENYVSSSSSFSLAVYYTVYSLSEVLGIFNHFSKRFRLFSHGHNDADAVLLRSHQPLYTTYYSLHIRNYNIIILFEYIHLPLKIIKADRNTHVAAKKL